MSDGTQDKQKLVSGGDARKAEGFVLLELHNQVADGQFVFCDFRASYLFILGEFGRNGFFPSRHLFGG